MLYILEMFRKHFSPSEAKLRAMYRIGVEAGRKQVQEELAKFRMLPPAQSSQKVVVFPVQPAQMPLQGVQRPSRTGALASAYHKTFPIPARPGKRTAHFTPAQRKQILFASRLTATDIPAIKDWPDAG